MSTFRERAKALVAQMTLEEKASVSHRGKALESFVEKLETYLGK